MKKLPIAVVTVLMLMLLACPAMAAVNFSVNGKSYQSAVAPQTLSGTTMVPLSMVEKTLGADVSVTGNKISIRNNTDILELTLGSKNAVLNGKAILLPQAPVSLQGQVMVPARGVLDSLGAAMSWQAAQQTVALVYNEQRQGMTAEDIITKANDAMAKYNSYKTKIDMTQHMSMTGMQAASAPVQVDAKASIDMAAQNKPFLFYGKTIMTMVGPGMPAKDMETEMLGNTNGFYFKSADTGWVKMNLPGLDMQALIEQSGGADPVGSLKQMKQAGVILSLGNERQKQGRNYYVVTATMGKDSLTRILSEAMQKAPLASTGNQAMDSMLQQMMKNMQGELSYTTLIDQETFLPAYMDFDSRILFNMTLPSAAKPGTTETIKMDTSQIGSCEIYGFGENFTVPDVSQAKELSGPAK